MTVQRASSSQWEAIPVLEVLVTLRTTSATPQLSVSTEFFTCSRAAVWQGLPFLGSQPLPASVVAAGHTVRGTLRYQRPPDVLTFGLVFFCQAPSGEHPTGIWGLQGPE